MPGGLVLRVYGARWLVPSASYGSISDTDLDFSSGDYGAYFDSLEIELEPVKKPAKS